jgi:hypothetical protein
MIEVSGTARDDWGRLWQLAERLAAGTGFSAAGALESIGLILMEPSDLAPTYGYECSPVGSAVFATTGGDGVHFSLLPLPALGLAPVVMTVPMEFDRPNIVVGGDLREFLALGCTTGYVILEQLAYADGRAEMISTLQHHQPPPDPLDPALRAPLIEEFDLQPWPDVEGRLADLDRRVGPYIRLSA